jgi:ribonuclease HII
MPVSNKKKGLNKESLIKYFSESSFDEIGIDEVGRGPLFGRVYCAAVILPKNNNFKYELLKDSKKFSSKKKLLEVYNYLIENVVCYSVSWVNEREIDKNNILSSTHKCMHKCISKILEKMDIIYDHKKLNKNYNENYFLLVDGNNFKNFNYFNNYNNQIENINHICIEGGDNKYCSIAAASIIAKIERDKYIENLCEKNNLLIEYYDLLNNKGYGTKKHLDGIKNYGITNMHRKSYGICKISDINYNIKLEINNDDYKDDHEDEFSIIS